MKVSTFLRFEELGSNRDARFVPLEPTHDVTRTVLVALPAGWLQVQRQISSIATGWDVSESLERGRRVSATEVKIGEFEDSRYGGSEELRRVVRQCVARWRPGKVLDRVVDC